MPHDAVLEAPTSSTAAGVVNGTVTTTVPMVLAVQWALAQHVDLPALSVSDMATTHGVLNGIGFVIAGLAGWLLAGVSSPATGAALTRAA